MCFFQKRFSFSQKQTIFVSLGEDSVMHTVHTSIKEITIFVWGIINLDRLQAGASGRVDAGIGEARLPATAQADPMAGRPACRGTMNDEGRRNKKV